MKNKDYFYSIGVILILAVLGTMFSLSLYRNKNSGYKRNIGKSVILFKDTSCVFKIVDYNSILETYVLSNGLELSIYTAVIKP